MFNKKASMAFDTLQVEAVEGFSSFTNTIGHRIINMAWAGKRDIG